MSVDKPSTSTWNKTVISALVAICIVLGGLAWIVYSGRRIFGVEALFWYFFIAAGCVMAGYSIMSAHVRKVLWRAVALALPIGLIGYGAFLALEPQFADNEKRFLYVALISGGVVATGWIFTFLLQSWREDVARSVKVEETLIALHEEIFDFLADIKQFSDQNLTEDDRAEVQERQVAEVLTYILGADGETSIPEMIAGDANYFRYVILAKELKIFESVISDVQILPQNVIPSLVGVYSQMQDLQMMQRAVQDEKFWQLPQDRRAELFFEYENVRLEAIKRACKAWRDTNAHLKEPYKDIYVFRIVQEHLKSTDRDMPDFKSVMSKALKERSDRTTAWFPRP